MLCLKVIPFKNCCIKTLLNININKFKKFNINKLSKLLKSDYCIFYLLVMLYNI